MGEHTFEAEWAGLKAEWKMLSRKAKRAAWDRFTQDVDEGAAGWNRYHPILWPAYEVGDQILAEMLS